MRNDVIKIHGKYANWVPNVVSCEFSSGVFSSKINTLVYLLIVEIVFSLKCQENFFSVDKGPLSLKHDMNRYCGTYSDTKLSNVKQPKRIDDSQKNTPSILK